MAQHIPVRHKCLEPRRYIPGRWSSSPIARCMIQLDTLIMSTSAPGGSSNIFPIQDYQSSAVATFFKDHNPPYPNYEGLVADINKGGLRKGKSTLGLLNSELYLNPSMLNHITNGPNPRCSTIGFSAVEGWDPVTGWGHRI